MGRGRTSRRARAGARLRGRRAGILAARARLGELRRARSGRFARGCPSWEASCRSGVEYLERLPPIESSDHGPRQELFDIEKEVVTQLWKELRMDPLLAAFDEAIAEVL